MNEGPPPARPVYLPAAPDVVFGMFHPTVDPATAGTAVLICPPWGWDEVASYRSRRTWAEHLARNGHPTLRIDLPGTGDSGGAPGDSNRVGAWTAAVTEATAWLARTTPSGRVAVIGLGLGGLVAGQAIAAGAAIDELVLWAAPSQGRALLREQRAFGRLQSDRYGDTDGVGTVLPEGWLEIGGFAQSADTIAATEQIDLRVLNLSSVRRALLLARDGLPVDPALRARLEEAGVQVTVAPGPGWGTMCFHPERYAPPVEVFETVASWLAPGQSAAAAAAANAAPEAGSLEAHRSQVSVARTGEATATIPVGGRAVRETAFGGSHPVNAFFGILAEPMSAPKTDVCAVFLNAGAVRRIGPNRLWVEAARQWAQEGIPTFRADVEGIGDANGDGSMYLDVHRFYTADREAQVMAILDELESRGLGPKFALLGLCAGAYSAFNTAAVDPRVVLAVAVNPRLLVWDPQILHRRNAYLVNKVLERGTWQRILRGETTPARLFEIGRAAAAEAPRAARRYATRLRGGSPKEPWVERLEGLLDRVRDAGVRLVVAFAGDEPLHDELRASGIVEHLASWPNVVLDALPGADHTLRPIAAQRAFHRLLDRELERIIAEPVEPAA